MQTDRLTHLPSLGETEELVPIRSMARLRIFIPKEELLWGLEVFVLIVFCFVFKDEGINPIHLFVFSFFPIIEPGKYPKGKKKKRKLHHVKE